MNPDNERPNLGGSFQQALAGLSDQQIDGIQGIGTFRLINCVELAIRRSARWIAHWRQRRIAIGKLQALNDHYLKDIGLDRSEIVWSAKETIRLDTHWS